MTIMKKRNENEGYNFLEVITFFFKNELISIQYLFFWIKISLILKKN